MINVYGTRCKVTDSGKLQHSKEKPCTSATFPTIYPTRKPFGLNSKLRGEDTKHYVRLEA
jgi:hypothetical protein